MSSKNKHLNLFHHWSLNVWTYQPILEQRESLIEFRVQFGNGEIKIKNILSFAACGYKVG